MHQQRLHGRFIFLGLSLVIALVFAMPMWVLADTAPTSVGVNTPVKFTGSGFAPNESLSVFEIGPDNNPVLLPGIQTDGNGGFTISVTFPSAGAWTVTAHSLVHGTAFVGNYVVSAAAGTTTTTTTSSSGTTATGMQVAIGASTPFSGSGFNANEIIAIWETGPDGPTSAVTALPQSQADANGAFTASVSFPSAGQWQVTAHGLVSGHDLITPFAVGITGSTSPPAGVLPVTTGTIGGPGFNGTAANIGSPVIFSGSGFNANEHISLWMTAPDATVTVLAGVQADNIGSFADSVIFPSAGNWQVTAHGHDSAHEIIGRYAVTDPSSGVTTAPPNSTFTSPFADVPVKATTGTIVTYTATGFNAGENVSVWTTAPDATVTPQDTVQASSTGRAVVSTSFGTVGVWQITLHGRDSGHQVVGKYQVTAS